jgi:UDP-N-acetylglucosamine 2-epimerase (non-hydrolysing)
MKRLLFIYGTRPEAIKMAPLIKEFRKDPGNFNTAICVTAQHREMLDSVMDFFDLKADYDLNLMMPNQTLTDFAAKALKGIESVLDNYKPDIVFVQGDTTTAFTATLAAYFKQIPVAHVEAGLRSGNLYSPFPEEGNRIMVSHLAEFHFAPTLAVMQNLLNENIKKNVFIVGNTVIDALFKGLEIIDERGEEPYNKFFSFLDTNKKIILITGHRRESFGIPFEEICLAIKEIAEKNKDVEIVYPVHLNPNVREPVNRILRDCPNIYLLEPLDYPFMIWLMRRCYLVLTDSGGIQEEAPSLRKPVLVMREVTERMEGINAGTARLVGTSRSKIVDEVTELLKNSKAYNNMISDENPYGDGTASLQIVRVIADLN